MLFKKLGFGDGKRILQVMARMEGEGQVRELNQRPRSLVGHIMQLEHEESSIAIHEHEL